MKSISFLVASMLLFAGSAPALAQGDISTGEQLEAARALVREGALQIVREELILTDEEREKFWPLYEKYRAEILAVENTYVDLLREFLQKYYGYDLGDADAREYVKEYFSIQSDLLKIRKKYVRRFNKVLPSVKVMRLYQIENKIRAEVDAALAITVPLADPN